MNNMIFGKFINKYYKKYVLFFIVAFLAIIAVDWVQLYLPEFLGELVNLFKPEVEGAAIDQKLLLSLILKIIVIALIMFVGRVLWRVMLFTPTRNIETGLRKDMYLKAERLSLDFYHENKIGTILSWMSTDLETVEDCIGWGTLMLVDSIFLTTFTLVKMFVCSWGLTFIALIPILLIAVWGMLVEKYMSIKWNERQEAYDRLYDFSQESFSGIKVIKAFVKENQQIHYFSKIAKRNKDVNVNFYRISIIFDVVISILISLILSIIMGFGGWFVYATVVEKPISIFNTTIKLNAGELITFIGYFSTLIWPMMALGQVVTMMSRGKTSYKRIANFLNSNESIKDKDTSIELKDCEGKIEFKNFSFSYPGDKNETLKNISLIIKPGESIGVIGKIGSGKTTLFTSLIRFYNVNEGQIYIDDIDLMNIKIKSLRNNIAIANQDTFLFQDSIKNNINYYKEDNNINMDEIIAAADFADVHSNILEFSEGYETVSGERGQTLSGGQKQRISIARAYMKKSPILILDDSVSAVDIKTEEKILNNIKNERKGMTTILISSRVSTVSKLDKIIVLSKGELEAFDTPENLLNISPTYKKMFELQKLENEEGGK